MSEKKEKLYINIVLAFFIVSIICCFTLYPILCDSVSAEPLTDNSVLNFNQLVLNENINRTYPKLSVVQITKTGLNIVNHKFYIHFVKNTPGIVAIGYNNGTSNVDLVAPDTTGSLGYIFSCSKVIYFSVYSTVENLSLTNFNIIDLTLMFGAGNEPTTVDEVKSLFPSPYYFYNAGSPLPLSNVDSYSNGYADALNQYSSSFKIKSTPMNTYMLLEKYDYNTSGEIVKEHGDIGGSELGFGYYVVFDSTYGYLPFNISGGTDVTLKCEYISNLDSGLTTSDFPISLDFYYLVNSSLVNVYHKEFSNQSQLNAFHSFDFKVNIPIDVNGLYFQFGGKYLVYNLSAEYTSFDLNEFINTSISDAYQKGIDSVDIESIKSQSFNKGKQAGIESANKYTFGALFSSVIDAPIKAITGLLNFEVFGVNLKSFMLSLFTLGLVIAIVKLFLGNIGGGNNAK